jgi:hypothetical protein
LQIASCALEVVHQPLFTEVERVQAIFCQVAEEIWIRTPARWSAAPDESWPIIYSMMASARRILDARTSGIAFKASRFSSGMENVT